MLGLHRDCVLHHLAMEQNDHLKDRLVDLQSSRRGGAFSMRRADPADHLAGAGAVLDDADEALPQLLQRRRLGRRASAARPGRS